MAKIDELKNEAVALGITLTGKEDAKEISALIKEKKNADKPSKDAVYVWVKDRAYINDKERVDSGLYLLNEVPERFNKMGATVEVLGKEVSSRKLGDIAIWAGMANSRDLSDEDLIEKLLSVFKPF